jgi:hypothetical protein
MASTYVNDLRLNEMATGDGSGTWGTTTNTNLELIAEAFSYGTEAITTNADTHTTTIADGATDPGRALYLKYTGTLDSACTITIGPNTVSKVWIIENGTSGSQDIIISQGSGANITIPAGDTKVVYSDGAGAGAAFFDAFASLNVVDLKVQDDLTVTGDIDVDGTTNLDVVDIDGAVDMASTLTVTGAITGSSAAFTQTNTLVSPVSARYNAANKKIAFNINNSNGQGFIASNSNSTNASGNQTYDITNTAAKIDFGSGITIDTAVSGSAGGTITYVNNAEFLPTGIIFNEGGANLDFRVESDDNANMLFVDGGNNRVGIGKAAASQPFEVGVSSVFDTAVIVNETGGDHDFRVESDGKTHMLFVDGGANQVTIGSSDLIGTLSVNGSASDGFLFSLVGGGYQGLQTFTNTAVGNGQVVFEPITVPGSGVAQQYTSFKTRTVGGGSTVHNVIIDGSLSKGSGSFKIDHPLPSKKDTHHLIHSFIEGPQADNIYRGKVDLVAGSATANIDTVAGMTEGTFVALNREVQCFTTNESNWDAVKGSVSGNILTIESENSESTATISWLVIGERKDQHMYDTDWTDDDGKVIVEPIKS